MELRQLKTFQTVASLLSFNRAADVLHYAQSTVSAQIKALEDELKVSLFDRLNNRIVLTEAGESLIKYAQKLIAIEEETFMEVSGRKELKGSLTVRVPQTVITYYLPSVLAEFQTRFPKVHLDFNSCTVPTLAHELSTGTIDLAFLLTESLQSANLEAEMLGIETLVLVTHPEHPLVQKNRVVLKDLDGQTLLFPGTDCDYPVRFKKTLAAEHVKPAAMPQYNSIEAIKHCIMSGFGITLLPQRAVERKVEKGKLVILPWDEAPFETALFMVWHKGKWMTPTLRTFLKTVKQTLSR